MDTALLRDLSSKLKITPERIFREYWELNILKELSGEPWSSSLGFKGGTALRLAYGSPRFSDGLDFCLLRASNVEKMFQWARVAAQKLHLDLSDEANKRNTCLIEFRIRSDALPQPVKLKIEISKRPLRAPIGKYELKLLTSQVTNIQVLLSVAPLDMLWQEKLSALNDRREPRDLFDLWYISQVLRRPLPSPLPKIPSRSLRLVLNKYLPLNYQRVIAELEAL